MRRWVELRYFGGLSIDETAEALQSGAMTVKRDWTAARAFLGRGKDYDSCRARHESTCATQTRIFLSCTFQHQTVQ
jgi:hypothetical protein